jgi:ComF family protein
MHSAQLLNQLLPRHCVLCGLFSGTENICPPCSGELPHNQPACNLCGLPLPGQAGKVCGACLKKPPPWDEAIAGLKYEFPVNQLVVRFKYKHNLACGQAIGSVLLEAIRNSSGPLPQAIVPVPLHRSRLFARSFNQAYVLAHQLSKLLELPVLHTMLKRTRRTQAQSGLDSSQRRKNVRGAFSCKQHGLSHVAVVDDVMTTGRTLEECTRSLKRAGTESVTVWVAARALYEPGSGSRI